MAIALLVEKEGAAMVIVGKLAEKALSPEIEEAICSRLKKTGSVVLSVALFTVAKMCELESNQIFINPKN